ncbi:type VI secretion system tip protein VgrG, partial [Salmonella enterica subsp. enterica]|nr:type VI secretion system tip protein VgrG [Salmonella enterica subsp. enterica]
MSSEGLRFTLSVDGIVEMAMAVVGFSLHQQHSVPFILDVDIASGLFDLTAEDFPEKKAVLTVWQGDIPQRYVSGIVTEVQLGVNNGWQMRYYLTVSPPVWRAGLRQNFRIFQQQDIQTISAQLLKENGVTEWMPLFYEEHPAREFCVQYGESDLAFLTRLWTEEGIFFYERCGKAGPEQKLAVCDDVAGLSKAGALAFNPDTTTGGTTEYISEFCYRAQISVASVETQDYTFKTPCWPGYYSHDGESLNGQRAEYEVFDYPGRFKDEQHGRDFARYQTEGWRSSAETANGVSNSAGLWPGVRFTLTGHPSGTLNREWQVVGSTLRGEQPQALHGSHGEGTTLSNQFEVIPADRTWRHAPLPKPGVDGPQSAIVTGPKG